MMRSVFGAVLDQSTALNADLPVLRHMTGAFFFVIDWTINLSAAVTE